MDKDDDDAVDTSIGVVRYPTMPSLVALQQMRNRLHLAQLGKKLMKWTALATMKELRKRGQDIATLIHDYDVKVRTAFIALARARYFVPHMNHTVLETVPNKACITVAQSLRAISAVKAKHFHVIQNCRDAYPYLGMSKGGIQVQVCKDMWLELIKQMVLICECRDTFLLIDQANKNASKKQNVLQRCIIPRIVLTMAYITSELDEMEREETFRLKRFKQLRYEKLDADKAKKELESEVPEPVPSKLVVPKPVVPAPVVPETVVPEPVVPEPVDPEPVVPEPEDPDDQ